MLSDLEIAQKAKMKPIMEIAGEMGLAEDDVELYGKYKAKTTHVTCSTLVCLNIHQLWW